jgi:ABC-type uncharacterized transport system ATPase component
LVRVSQHIAQQAQTSARAVIVSRVLDHNFTGPAFTLGIEEELMICDAETLELSQSIEQILAAGLRQARADAVRARGGDAPLLERLGGRGTAP